MQALNDVHGKGEGMAVMEAGMSSDVTVIEGNAINWRLFVRSALAGGHDAAENVLSDIDNAVVANDALGTVGEADKEELTLLAQRKRKDDTV